jgi:hypothetical protein
MSGRPVLAAMESLIEDRGGDDWVFDQLADGCTVRSIADQLGVNRRMMYQWRDREGKKEQRKPVWEAAVRMSAEADLENTMVDFEKLERTIETMPDGSTMVRSPTNTEVALVTGRAKFRQWLASRKDPERYGERSDVNVNVNYGSQHLAALADAKRLHAPVRTLLAAPVIDVSEDEHEQDVEIVDDDGLAALM